MTDDINRFVTTNTAQHYIESNWSMRYPYCHRLQVFPPLCHHNGPEGCQGYSTVNKTCRIIEAEISIHTTFTRQLLVDLGFGQTISNL